MAIGIWFYGPSTAKDVVIWPSGVDPKRLELTRLADGATARQVVELGITSLIGYNREPAFGLGKSGRLMSLLTYGEFTPALEQSYGTMTATPRAEFYTPEAQRLALHGWMPKMNSSEVHLARTTEQLELTTLRQMGREFAAAFNALRRRKLALAFYRMLAIEDWAIGDTGYSPGWVGGGTRAYYPPEVEGVPFASDHNHYLDEDVDVAQVPDATRQGKVTDKVEEGWDTLYEHGFEGTPETPLVLLYNKTLRDYVQGITTWKAKPSYFVDPGDTPFATLGQYTIANGVIEKWDILTVEHRLMPPNKLLLVASGGINNGANAMVRTFPATQNGEGADFLDLDLEPRYRQSPLTNTRFDERFGFIIANREQGVAIHLKNGSTTYVSPTLTEMGLA